ncbi:hypothetical protein L1887_62732 [Cichorium endivia]|nr:hypothetical protein L1887_62732 [Cichorium endivia]
MGCEAGWKEGREDRLTDCLTDTHTHTHSLSLSLRARPARSLSLSLGLGSGFGFGGRGSETRHLAALASDSDWLAGWRAGGETQRTRHARRSNCNAARRSLCILENFAHSFHVVVGSVSPLSRSWIWPIETDRQDQDPSCSLPLLLLNNNCSHRPRTQPALIRHHHGPLPGKTSSAHHVAPRLWLQLARLPQPQHGAAPTSSARRYRQQQQLPRASRLWPNRAPITLGIRQSAHARLALCGLAQSRLGHTRVASASDRANDDRALAAVRHVVRNMSDPNAEVEVDPSRPGYVVPDHLKDLPPEELPEDQRATVLSEIEQFRLAAAARDAETRRREAEFERQRAVERARRADLQASSSRNGEDAQSYRKPVDFHAASSYDAQADIVREPEDADQVAEDERRERAQAAARAAASDAERAYLVRERQRLAHWQKEADRQAAEAERWERDAASQLRRWTDWSDETATRKELFYTDRPRWRQFRAPARRREQEADARDRELEQDEKARAQHESETFLAQQAADMARLTQQQRAAGVLVDSSLAPIKITFTGTEAGPSATGNAGWEWIDAAMVRKYRSWVDAQIEESLGEKVDELVNVVVETIQSHASASALVEVVEPVLDDEAEAFVEKLWRMLLVDSQAAAAGILTS